MLREPVPVPEWAHAAHLASAGLHHTIATGDVIAKETAGAYALATFPDRWHPLIDEALAYRRSQPPRTPGHAGPARAREAAAFARAVIRDAHAVADQLHPASHRREGILTSARAASATRGSDRPVTP